MRDVSGTAGGRGSVGAGGAGAGTSGSAGAAAPRLRGVLHAGAFPVAATAGVVLVTLAPTGPARLAAAVYGVAGMALFGVSAAYHRSPLGSRRKDLLARLDHMSILLLIAGTYTPLVHAAHHHQVAAKCDQRSQGAGPPAWPNSDPGTGDGCAGSRPARWRVPARGARAVEGNHGPDFRYPRTHPQRPPPPP